METISLNTWIKYKNLLANLSQKAADEFRDAVFSTGGKWGGAGLGNIPRNELIDYAYGLVTKYSEGATEAACLFYDAIAELSGQTLPPAIPAETANMGEVTKTVNGVMKQSLNEEMLSSAIGRLVKQAGQDTTMQNAIRDGAQFAWIPNGDTCAFCITLASRGWQYASQKALRNGHAEHIHSNCDCAYAIRFNNDTKYDGYDPQIYEDMYYNTNTDSQGKITYYREDGVLKKHKQTASDSRINDLRRQAYQANKERINEQKRTAYAKRKELNSSKAEEINVN